MTYGKLGVSGFLIIGAALASCQVQTPTIQQEPLEEKATPSLSIQAVGDEPQFVLVQFKNVKAASKFRAKKKLDRINIQQIAVPKGEDAAAYAQSLVASGDAAMAEPDYPVYATLTPNDPMLSQQYGLTKIQAFSAWDINQGSSGVKIAVVDTGIDSTHPDLIGKVATGYDFINNDANASDDNGHGTHVAGIASASTNNGVGVAGTAINATLLPVKVLSANGSGSMSSVAQGIIWAADQGAAVINLSLGASTTTTTLNNAVAYAINKGSTVIAAMGNNGRNVKNYPGAITGVIAVGATGSNDARVSFSNYGSWISVVAPGSSIVSTMPSYPAYLNTSSGLPQNYASLSGTSMATPFVSGLAALIKAQNPTMTPAQIKTRLQTTSDDLGTKGFDNYYGYGRINALRALQNAVTPTPAPSPTPTPKPRRR